MSLGQSEESEGDAGSRSAQSAAPDLAAGSDAFQYHEESLAGAAAGSAASPEPSFQTLCPRSVRLDRWIGAVVAAVVTIILLCSTAPLLLMLDMPLWGKALIVLSWLVIGGGLGLLAYLHPKWQYDRTRWAIGSDGFHIHRGIIWRHQVAIPAARVQHVDVSQGPLERMLELGKLIIHTAGTENASIEVPGLEHATALGLRDELIKQKELVDAEQ